MFTLVLDKHNENNVVAKIGRNDPCPCGSGKKYNNCCAARVQRASQKPDVDTFRLNQEVAYEGVIGRLRAEFCTDYIEKKTRRYSELQLEQAAQVARNGETITCQKGCSLCCTLYVQANVQECEAIVYYLYHHETALEFFLRGYPEWRERLKKNGDIFKRCDRLVPEMMAPGKDEAEASFREEAKHYHKQNIPCPFLSDNLCSIYEVRPLTCAGMVVSTPSEWCHPLNVNKPKAYVTVSPELLDISFYYRSLAGIMAQCMPVMVYSILKNGYGVISQIPGLDGLIQAVTRDPEVGTVIDRHISAP